MCRVTSSPKADSERSRVYCCSSCPSSVIVSLFIRTRRKRNPTKMLGRHSILGESFEDIGAMAGRKSDFGNTRPTAEAAGYLLPPLRIYLPPLCPKDEWITGVYFCSA